MSKSVHKKRTSAKKSSPSSAVDEIRSPEPSTLGGSTFKTAPSPAEKGMGSEFAGQSGDLQGLSSRQHADSESVEELVAEGQYREAEIVGAVEDSRDPDEGEVRTRQVPADDIPDEYLDND